jgi:dolichol-phosphate mannosyltransferase
MPPKSVETAKMVHANTKRHQSHTIDNPPPLALSVVVPCFNEEGNIAELERRVAATCRAVVGNSYEIVLVNDGSKDGTWAAILHAAEEGPNIVGVDLSRNYGHQLALSAGLSVSRGDRILIIDADLQDPPELLADMMKLMDDDADVVYGQRLERPGDSGLRKAASSIFYRMLQRLSDVDIPLDAGDFRLISRRVLDRLLEMPEQHRYIRGMISWVGFKQVPFTYERLERTEGETSYSLSRLFGFAIDGITGFSMRPLRIVTFVGLATAMLSALYAFYIFIVWFIRGEPVAGWPSLMAVVLLLGGVQMIFLGLIGEYVGRVFQEVKGRPLFLISEIVTSDTSEPSG